MSAHTKEELENMLADVINELDLSESMIEKHGAAPAELVKQILARKDLEISSLKAGSTHIHTSFKPFCLFLLGLWLMPILRFLNAIYTN